MINKSNNIQPKTKFTIEQREFFNENDFKTRGMADIEGQGFRQFQIGLNQRNSWLKPVHSC